MTRLESVKAAFARDREKMQETLAKGREERKCAEKVRITDAQGKPVAGAKVSYRLKKHDFWHGSNIFMTGEMETPEKNEKYKKLIAGAFNQATLPFYWNGVEPEEGRLRFQEGSVHLYRRPPADRCVEFCREAGITPKLHCLNYDQWTPMWVPREVPEVKRLLEKRISEIAARYADKIPCMEVINETLCGYNPGKTGSGQDNRASTPFFWEDDLITWSFATARKYLPKTELVINEATGFAWDTFRKNRSWYASEIRDALAGGAEIDTIGLQFHMFFRREDEGERALPYYSYERLWNSMEYYRNAFHRPLQVTEVTIPAYSWEKEDEEVQAEIIENLYTIWFSHPSMEAVTYWNVVDGYAHFAPQGDMTSGENYYHGGLARFDHTPKPAYDVITELFRHRFVSQGTAETDAEGKAALCGYPGEYELAIEKNGVSEKAECHIAKGEGEKKIVL